MTLWWLLSAPCSWNWAVWDKQGWSSWAFSGLWLGCWAPRIHQCHWVSSLLALSCFFLPSMCCLLSMASPMTVQVIPADCFCVRKGQRSDTRTWWWCQCSLSRYQPQALLLSLLFVSSAVWEGWWQVSLYPLPSVGHCFLSHSRMKKEPLQVADRVSNSQYRNWMEKCGRLQHFQHCFW